MHRSKRHLYSITSSAQKRRAPRGIGGDGFRTLAARRTPARAKSS
jgi:hypothetical protein